MGGGGKGGTSTSTVSIPPEVLARYNAVNTKAEEVAKTPFQAYSTDPNAFVAPLSNTQQAGIANTNAAAGAAQPWFNAAGGLAGASAYNVNPAQYNDATMASYMSPFANQVIGETLAPMQQQQAADQQALKSASIKRGSFGGDRADISDAVLRGQQSQATGATVAGLLNPMFNQAQQQFNTQQAINLGSGQANRQNYQNLAQLYGSLGTGAQNAALQGSQAQLTAGQQEQATKQAGLTALYNQFLQQQSYPFQTTQFLANIAQGTGALSGSTTTNQQPSSFFSDERLKTDIERIGETYDGQKIIKFRYKGEKGPKQIGLVAQDVEKHHPEAVGESHGYKTVDYDKATRDAAKRGHFYEGGLAGASMGGGVHVGDDRLGFGFGGGLPSANDQSVDPATVQAQAYAAMARSPVTPPPTGLNIPMVAPPNRGLMLGQFRPQQPTGMQTALNDASTAVNVATGGTKLYDWFNEEEDEDPEVNQTDKDIKKKDTGVAVPKKSYGGLAGDRGHYSTAGSIPYQEDAEEDIKKQGTLEIPNEPNQYKLLTPQNAGQMQQPGTLGDAAKSGMQMYNTGKKAVDLGTKALDFLKGPTPAGELAANFPAAPVGTPLPPVRPESLGSALAPTAEATAAAAPVAETLASAAPVAETLASVAPILEAPAGLAGVVAPVAEGLGAAGVAAEGAGLMAGLAEGLGVIGAGIAEFAPLLLSFFSDERLKENISKVGETNDGQNIYKYNFKGDPRTQIGLIAQEVAKDHPEAVGKKDGYLTVDYDRATKDSERHKRRGYALEGEVQDEPRQPDPDLVQLASADPAAIDLAKKVTTPKVEAPKADPMDAATASEPPLAVAAPAPAPVELKSAVAILPPPPAPTPRGLVPTPDKKPDRIPATKNNLLDTSAAAIKGIESSGNYNTVGPKVIYKGGPNKGMEDYAYGAYGVMGVNVGPWTEAALGKYMTPKEFLENRNAQDQVFRHYFGQLIEKHGNPLDAASVWFSGKTRAEDDGRRDVLGTSIPGYVKKFAAATGVDSDAPTASRARTSEHVGKEPTTLGSIVSQITHQAQKVLPESHEGKMALLSGIFGMLASPSPYLLNAIGQGGLAGVNAYAAAQRQQNDMLKTNLQLLNNNFSTIDGETFVNKMNGETYTKAQMKELYSKIVGRTDSGKTILGALEAAKGTKPSVTEVKPPPAPSAPPAPAPVEAKPEPVGGKPAPVEAPSYAKEGQGTAPVDADGAKPPVAAGTPSSAPPAVVRTPSGELVAKDVMNLMQQRSQDTAYWDKGPAELNYPKLVAEADRLQKSIQSLEAQAARAMPFNKSAASGFTSQANSQRTLMNDIRQRAAKALESSIAPDLDRLKREADIRQKQQESAISTEQQLTVQQKADELTRAREKEAAEHRFRLERQKFEEEMRLKNENKLVTVFPSLTGNAVSMTKAQLLEANKQRASEGQQPIVTERNPIAVKKMEEVMKNDSTMDEQQQQRQVLRQRATALKDVLEKFETGKFAEQKNELVAALKSAGFNIGDTDTMNVAEFQKLVKNSISQVYDQAKAIGNKVLVAEIQGLSKAVVAADLSPAANRSILAQLEGLINYQDHHHKDYMLHRMANPDDIHPEQFNEKWRRDKNNDLNDYVKDAERHMAPKGVLPDRDPSKLVSGQKYQTKQGMFYWDGKLNDGKGGFTDAAPPRKYKP